MICGISQVAYEYRFAELRVAHNEVFGQTCAPEQAAGHTCEIRR